jgi:hypothetical protein
MKNDIHTTIDFNIQDFKPNALMAIAISGDGSRDP